MKQVANALYRQTLLVMEAKLYVTRMNSVESQILQDQFWEMFNAWLEYKKCYRMICKKDHSNSSLLRESPK